MYKGILQLEEQYRNSSDCGERWSEDSKKKTVQMLF